jgi:FAD/FMN-containing dehydrogenase
LSVQEIRAVTQDGEIVTCSQTENADLFWAARGAGPGFFAVVLSFRLGLYPLPKAMTMASYTFPAAQVAQVSRWASEVGAVLSPIVELSVVAATAPPDLSLTPGKTLGVSATVFADSAEEAEHALEPFRACPIAELALSSQLGEQTSFDLLYDGSATLWPSGLRYIADTLWSRADLETLLIPITESIANAPSDKSLVLAPILATTSQTALPDMAFSMLGSTYLACYAVWESPEEDSDNIRWLREMMENVEPLGVGHYVAESDLLADFSRAPRSYLPMHWERLQALRAKYDPEGVFQPYLQPSRGD